MSTWTKIYLTSTRRQPEPSPCVVLDGHGAGHMLEMEKPWIYVRDDSPLSVSSFIFHFMFT